MEKFYVVDFRYDNGYVGRRQEAIVKAMNEDEANKKIRQYILNLDFGDIVDKIFSTKELTQDVLILR